MPPNQDKFYWKNIQIIIEAFLQMEVKTEEVLTSSDGKDLEKLLDPKPLEV